MVERIGEGRLSNSVLSETFCRVMGGGGVGGSWFGRFCLDGGG